jgi:hypothetical protein
MNVGIDVGELKPQRFDTGPNQRNVSFEVAVDEDVTLGPTLKAFANFSPGLRSGNPGSISLHKIKRNPDRVATRKNGGALYPGF